MGAGVDRRLRLTYCEAGPGVEGPAPVSPPYLGAPLSFSMLRSRPLRAGMVGGGPGALYRRRPPPRDADGRAGDARRRRFFFGPRQVEPPARGRAGRRAGVRLVRGDGRSGGRARRRRRGGLGRHAELAPRAGGDGVRRARGLGGLRQAPRDDARGRRGARPGRPPVGRRVRAHAQLHGLPARQAGPRARRRRRRRGGAEGRRRVQPGVALAAHRAGGDEAGRLADGPRKGRGRRARRHRLARPRTWRPT